MSSATLKRPESKHFIILFMLSLLIIAALIRIGGASTFYYNSDEAMHVRMAEGSLSEVWQFSHYETHPPLGNFIRHYWLIISTDPAFVRSQSLIFGLALIILYYFIGNVLGGASAGLTCAALAAFSHGCIIQSFVVRNYIFFIFFISLDFYIYLLWRTHRRIWQLTSHVILGWMAVLTHFSAGFYIISLCLFETFSLYRRPLFGRGAGRKTILTWLCANTAILLVAAVTYGLWQPVLDTIKPHVALDGTHGLLTSVAMYPGQVLRYIVPGHSLTLSYMIFAGLGIMSCRNHIAAHASITLRELAGLAGGGFILGAILYGSGLYPLSDSRHSLWILPLILPAAGWMISLALNELFQRILPQSSTTHAQIPALILLISGCVLYNQQDRFQDGGEYVWQQSVWDSFNRYLATLKPTDLIVTERDDGILLTNLYRSMGSDALSGKRMAAIASYRDTRILFNPYYPRNYDVSVFLSTLREAQSAHEWDGSDRLVFMQMAWSRSPLIDLMTCNALEKQVITFPAFASPLSRGDIKRARAAIMLVSREEFEKQVLAPDGKAAQCIKSNK